MNTDPKKPLNDILTIVDYKGDKEVFIEQFVQLCIQKALVSMIKKLTDEQQDVLIAKLSASNDPAEHRTLIGAYFSTEYINYEMSRSTEMLLFDYLEYRHSHH